ncbi:MAG: hypothetical protein IKD45_02375 [Clostridia bacterium]|nr:hypothetical protein [Clostridia bacterium]
MYISTDCYYDIYLKGKDKKTVISEIVKLRSEIERIKLKMESPSYSAIIDPYSSDASDISKYREYLHSALRVMENDFSVPSDELLTQTEKRDREFSEKIGDISLVILTLGRYLQYRYELSLTEHSATRRGGRIGSEQAEEIVDIGEAREALSLLHLGEWSERYTSESYGYPLSEPTLWKLRVEYKSGAKAFYSEGAGIFPHNFNLLCRLMGVD